MPIKLRSVRQTNPKNKKVLLLVDYDTPTLKEGRQEIIADDTRIQRTLPTLRYLIEKGAKVILLSKRGRPNGKVVESLRMDVIAKHLGKLIEKPVKKLNKTVGSEVEGAVNKAIPGDLLMLENVRFNKGESTNSKTFARSLARLGDIFVNDAFPLSHRAHASVTEVPKFLPSFAGIALEEEVKMLSQLIKNPQRPFVAIVGGAKISDKVDAICNLAKIADVVLVGGGVANNFLKAEGIDTFNSLLQDSVADVKKRNVNFVDVAGELMQATKQEKMLLHGYIPLPKIVYPLDVVAADSIKSPDIVTSIDLSNGNNQHNKDKKMIFLDIGSKTRRLYRAVIEEANTVFWNGPMGVFEEKAFSAGTKAIANAIAASSGTTIVGGGDTINAIKLFAMENQYNYVSAAGGAALEFLAGKSLPGIAPLIKK